MQVLMVLSCLWGTSPATSSSRALYQYACLPQFVIQVDKNSVVKGLRRRVPSADCGVSASKVDRK